MAGRHPVPSIMVWAPMNRDFCCAPTGALMEERYLSTERIGTIFLKVWLIFVERMPCVSMLGPL